MPCPSLGWRGICPPVIRRQCWNRWFNDALLVQLVWSDQYERVCPAVTSISHAEGRWFDPSRDHFETVQVRSAFLRSWSARDRVRNGEGLHFIRYLAADDRRIMGLDLPFCAGRWRRVMRAEGCDRAAPTSVVGGTEQWWGVGTEPSGRRIGGRRRDLRCAQLSTYRRMRSNDGVVRVGRVRGARCA